VHNLDLEITGELSPFFGHRTSPLWKMSTLVSKKSVSRKGGTPQFTFVQHSQKQEA
jgi:hypothetical protein